jgi:hypothetical protein
MILDFGKLKNNKLTWKGGDYMEIIRKGVEDVKALQAGDCCWPPGTAAMSKRSAEEEKE